MDLRWCLYGVIPVLVASSTVIAMEKPAPSERGRWAVLVGVDQYVQAESLKFCGADQRSLRDRLVASGFPAEQVILLHDKAQDRKYQPYKGNIEKQLDLMLNLVEEEDVVVVALSGHGVHLDGKSYFCPTDADLDDPQTLVSLDALYKKFENSVAALKVLFVDACRNDPRLPGRRAGRKLSPREEAREFTKSLERPPHGVVLLNSCTAGEVSYEDQEIGHGVFMHYVLEGLQGEADADGNGRVSIEELSRFANAKTKSFVLRKFNDVQRPFLKGDVTVDVLDFELARASGPNVASSSRNAKSIINSIGMNLTLIPAGEFEMGSEEDA